MYICSEIENKSTTNLLLLSFIFQTHNGYIGLNKRHKLLMRSYNWDYILYFGHCYWDGDCILCTNQVADGGSGLLSNLVCRRRRLPP